MPRTSSGRSRSATWTSTRTRSGASDLDHPDELRVDIDPTPGATWDTVRRVSLIVRDVLEENGLRGYPGTSGSRGMHIPVRLHAGEWDFVAVRRAAVALAREVERRGEGLATAKWWKEERPDGVGVRRLQPERQGPHGLLAVLRAPRGRRAGGLRAGVGRGARLRAGGLPHRHRAGAAARRSAIRRGTSTRTPARSTACSRWPTPTSTSAASRTRPGRSTSQAAGRAQARPAQPRPQGPDDD